MRRALIAGTVFFLGAATTAVAEHPDPRDMARIRALAHRLDEAAASTHHQAERDRHHFDRREERAFQALHRLAEEARHFHRQTERFFGRPAHTERDFRDVVKAYVAAARRLDDLHGSLHIERDFERAGRLVVAIDRSYGFLDHSRYGHYGSARGGYGYRGLEPGYRGPYDDRRHRRPYGDRHDRHR